MLFNDAVNCCGYTASVLGEWMSVGHWWHGAGRVKLKYWEKNLPSATWSTTNPTRFENPGVYSEKLAIRRLKLRLFFCNCAVTMPALERRHGTACILNVKICGTYDYHCVSDI